MSDNGIEVHAHEIDIDIAGIRIVSGATMSAPAGTVVGLIGPNGSGKSSLLKAIYRILRPTAGVVMTGDDDLWTKPPAYAANTIAVVLQDDLTEFEFTVGEIVALGRVPHRGRFGRRTQDDERAISSAMQATATEHLADRYIATLSGGERQRVFLARALAQQTPVLVLDEPTNHLDVLAQIEMLDLVVGLPATVLVALHDLNLAATYCDRLYVLDQGRIVAHGTPAEVLTSELVATVYGVAAQVWTNPLTGRPALAFGSALRPRAHRSDNAMSPSVTASTPHKGQHS
ncbi:MULTISPECIES: ABC transporter ATP-binding protein [Actinomycetes]|uniref:ABC transporter ATP-binding protein n=1 Tax=Actinomycetes TaxID=1760 RepID=UPI0004C03B27|nr:MULTISPECIES: ABC transporter ATP-binding protein [Actinomycetes]